MITYYRSNHGALETIDKPEPGCWINVYEPTEKELGWLSQSLDISPNFLSKAFDEEESAHADVDPDNDQVLVIVDCPYVVSEDCQHGKKITQYDTDFVHLHPQGEVLAHAQPSSQRVPR